MSKEYLRYQNFLLSFAKEISKLNEQKDYKNFYKLKVNDDKEFHILNSAIANSGPSAGENSWTPITNLEARKFFAAYLAKDVDTIDATGEKLTKTYKINFLDHPANTERDTRVFLDEITINKIGKNGEERLRNMQGHIKIKFTNVDDLSAAMPSINLGNPKETVDISINEILYSSLNNKGVKLSDKEAATAENTKFHIFLEYNQENTENDHDFIQYINKKILKIRVCAYQYEIKFADIKEINKNQCHELTIIFVGYMEAAEKDIRKIYNDLLQILNPTEADSRQKAINEFNNLKKEFEDRCKEALEKKQEIKDLATEYKGKFQESVKNLKVFEENTKSKMINSIFNDLPIYKIKNIDKRIFNLASIRSIDETGANIAAAAAIIIGLFFVTVAFPIFLLFAAAAGGIELFKESSTKNETKEADSKGRLVDNNFIKKFTGEINKNTVVYKNGFKVSEEQINEAVNKPTTLEVQADENGAINIYYFFLGDLLEKLLIEKKPIQYLEEHLFFDVPISRKDLVGDEIVDIVERVNIADLPISYEHFLVFLKENILDKKEDVFYVESFINDLLNYVESSIGMNYYGNSKNVSTTISITREIVEIPSVDQRNIFNESYQRTEPVSSLSNPPAKLERNTIKKFDENDQEVNPGDEYISATGVSRNILNSYKLVDGSRPDKYIFYKIYRGNHLINVNRNFFGEFQTKTGIDNLLVDLKDTSRIDAFMAFMQKEYSIPTFTMYDSIKNYIPAEGPRTRLSRKFDFSKVNLKYLRETQMTENKFKGFYREPYDFTLTANPLTAFYFENGTHIFILPDPRLLKTVTEDYLIDIGTNSDGSSIKLKQQRNKYFYNVFGLGGLYLITQVDILIKFAEVGVEPREKPGVAYTGRESLIDNGQSVCKLTCKFQAFGDGTALKVDVDTPADCKTLYETTMKEAADEVAK